MAEKLPVIIENRGGKRLSCKSAQERPPKGTDQTQQTRLKPAVRKEF